MIQTIYEKIKQRRRQMLVHSYLYYEKNVNIVSDYTWSKWALELVQLQKEYPQESSQVEFAEQFTDWDGSTGAFLVYNDDIKRIANHLYEYEKHTNIKKPTSKVKPKKSKFKGFGLLH